MSSADPEVAPDIFHHKRDTTIGEAEARLLRVDIWTTPVPRGSEFNLDNSDEDR
jgi:hypothetical protein